MMMMIGGMKTKSFLMIPVQVDTLCFGTNNVSNFEILA
jgi:hypothetical protein